MSVRKQDRGGNISKKNYTPTPGMQFSFAGGAQYSPASWCEKEDLQTGFIEWGKDNRLPERIYATYEGSSTLQSVINGSTDYTAGDLIEFFNLPPTFNVINADGDTIEEVAYKCMLDRWIFGGWAVQVQYNRAHEMTELIHLDMRRLRTNKTRSKFWYSKEWGTFHGSTNEYLTYKAFNPEEKETYEEDEFSTVFYFKGKKSRGVYPVPDWQSALKNGETQIEIQEFQYRSVKNDFLVNSILKMKIGNPTDDAKKKIEQQVNHKFCGSHNAAKLMIAYLNDSQDIEVVKVPTDSQADKFTELSENNIKEIFISLSASPVLFGLPTATGFANQNYPEAYTLYDKFQISPKQKETITQFDKILGPNSMKITKTEIVWPETTQSEEFIIRKTGGKKDDTAK